MEKVSELEKQLIQTTKEVELLKVDLSSNYSPLHSQRRLALDPELMPRL